MSNDLIVGIFAVLILWNLLLTIALMALIKFAKMTADAFIELLKRK